jgi:hypothetical protein
VLDKSPFQLNLAKGQEKAVANVRQEGLKTLGSFISPIAPKRAFLAGKIETLKEALEALKDLPKQHTFLLLRGSIQLLIRPRRYL